MTLEERFWAKVERTDTCWLWLGTTKSWGYGHFYDSRIQKQVKAHRFAYELLVGPIPEGLTIDHLCRNRACVNPAHLEPVTRRENILRGEGITAQNARKTHCKRGHEFIEENTRWIRKGRVCRVCIRMAKKEYRRRRLPAAGLVEHRSGT